MTFIHKSLLTLLIISVSTSVYGAPFRLTTRQATEVAKQNGIKAQELNTEFATKSSKDTCQTGEIACVDSAFAQCVDGKWSLTPCKSGSCFAVPESNKPGTALVCESEAKAAGRFEGVTGGVDGNNADAPATQSAPLPSTSRVPATVSAKVQSTISEPTPSQTRSSSTPESDDPAEQDDEECEEEEEEEEGEEEEECEEEEEPVPSALAADGPKTITLVVTRTIAPSALPTLAPRQITGEPLPITVLATDPSDSLPSLLTAISALIPTALPESASSLQFPAVSVSSPSDSLPVLPTNAPGPLSASAVPSGAPVTVTVTQLATVTVTQLVVPVSEPTVVNSVPISAPATAVPRVSVISTPIISAPSSAVPSVAGGVSPSPVIIRLTVTETSTPSATIPVPSRIVNPDPLSVLTAESSVTAAPPSATSIDEEVLKSLLTASITL